MVNGCDHPCITCNSHISSRSCTSCADGTYLFGDRCSPCDSMCKTCSDDYTCTSCTDEYYLEDGYCNPCEYPCITCLTKTFCLGCGKDFEFRNPPPSCSCLHDFYDSGNACIKCIAPCLHCTDTNTNSCISCIEGFFLEGT